MEQDVGRCCCHLVAIKLSRKNLNTRGVPETGRLRTTRPDDKEHKAIRAEWCKTQPFKEPIIHGNATFSISTGLCIQGERLNPHAMSYGYDKIRYPKPVFAGDTIKVKMTVIEKKDHPKSKNHGLITEEKITTNQKGEVFCVAHHVIFVEKRNP